MKTEMEEKMAAGKEEKLYNQYVSRGEIAPMVEYALNCDSETASEIADRYPESERLSEIALLSGIARNNGKPIGVMKYISYSREEWISQGEEAVEKLREMRDSL